MSSQAAADARRASARCQCVWRPERRRSPGPGQIQHPRARTHRIIAMSARRTSARLLHAATGGGGAASHRRPALTPAATLVCSAKAAQPTIKVENVEKVEKQPKHVADPPSLPKQPAAKRPRAIKTEKTRMPGGAKAAAAKAAAAASSSVPPAGWEQTWNLIVELRADRTAVVDRMGSVFRSDALTVVAPSCCRGHWQSLLTVVA